MRDAAAGYEFGEEEEDTEELQDEEAIAAAEERDEQLLAEALNAFAQVAAAIAKMYPGE